MKVLLDMTLLRSDMAIIKKKVSPAKERNSARQRKYFKDDLVQPFDKKGKPNREFIKRYGKAIYDAKRQTGL